MKRRDFLKLSGASSALAVLAPSLFLESCKKEDVVYSLTVREGDFSTVLPAIAMLLAIADYSLIAKETTSKIIGNKTSRVLGYQDSILGPIFKANNGEVASIQFTNNLAEDTNIHWHGLLVPQNMDGHPENLISAGASFNYNFLINQRAGLYWYHPHPHMHTGSQVYQGLAGLFIVNDTEEAALNLPGGDYELPLVIQDKRMYFDYSLNYSPTSNEVMTGYFGDYITFNGVNSPYKEVSTRWYRLRIVNGSTARIYNLALSNNANFYVIGSDGGLVPSTEIVNSIILAPGERVDMLVDFSSYALGTELYLQSTTFSGGEAQGNQSFKILKFIVSKNETDSFILPSTLSSIIPIPTSLSTYNRNWDLKQADHNAHEGMNMEMTHTINGKSFVEDEIVATVAAGSTEIWTFDNSQSDELHPMHIHGVHFQVLERIGGRGNLIATEKGWKDTVLLMAYEKVKVIITFPSNPGKFVIHCHNLEHEDSGMMLNFEIV